MSFINNKFNKLLAVILIALTSCKKIIHVDLNAAAPRIVIEGNISNQPGPYIIKVTKSVNFDQTNNFPPVTDAVVQISDDAGNSETLLQVSPGIYQTSTTSGTPGKTYTLKVTEGGVVYESTSYLPPPVEISYLTVDIGFDKDKRINVIFQDPPNIVNYYRCIEIVNDTTLNDISVDNDQFKDGALITQTISNDISKYKLKSGDRVTVLLQTIDKGTFEYFRTLSNILQQDGGGGPPPTTPTNPVSAFTNNALGYFNTFSETQKSITVP